MERWQQQLDNYITRGPYEDNSWNNWNENVGEWFGDDFFNAHETWIMSDDGLCSKWMNKLYENEASPERAAKVIERAAKIFKI